MHPEVHTRDETRHFSFHQAKPRVFRGMTGATPQTPSATSVTAINVAGFSGDVREGEAKPVFLEASASILQVLLQFTTCQALDWGASRHETEKQGSNRCGRGERVGMWGVEWCRVV